MKVLAGLAAANLLVFAVLALFVARSAAVEEEAQARIVEEGLLRPLVSSLGPEGRGGSTVESLLEWPQWHVFRDAVLVNRYIRLGPRGLVFFPTEVYLNPLGARHRPPDFDIGAALARIGEAIERGEAVPGRGTVAMPIEVAGEGGRKSTWGGGYFAFGPPEPPAAPLTMGRLALVMLAGTGLLTLFTWVGLSRLVLRPVEALAAASARLAEGGSPPVVAAPSRKDEVAALVRAFGDMARRIREHREVMEREVRLATEKAKEAERNLLLAQRLAATGTLAAGIAHEINNPLGGMMNAARALRRADLPADRREEYLDLLQEGLVRVEGTVRRILEFSPREVPPQVVPLAEPLRSALSLAEHRIRGEAVEVVERIDPSVLVQGDPRALSQAFLNLLLNALDAIAARPNRSAPGRIEVAVESEGGEAVARVRDNGAGMDPALLPRAVDLFFSTKPKGSGLGLSIVYGVVRDHGGTVDLRSRPGKEFEATLRLPLAPAS